MLYAELFERTAPVESPKSGARRFGISLSHIYGYDKNDDVINYDWDDDARGNAVRYRFIVGPNYHAFLHEMMPQINAAGWHLTVETKRGRQSWQLVFEPTLSPRTPRTRVFWHLTPRANLASVLQSGLLPKQSRHGFKYPQHRIYMLRNAEDARQMVTVFAQRDKRPIDYAVVRVDLRKAIGITLHLDPELAKVAVYTTQLIPPQFLSLADEPVSQTTDRPALSHGGKYPT